MDVITKTSCGLTGCAKAARCRLSFCGAKNQPKDYMPRLYVTTKVIGPKPEYGDKNTDIIKVVCLDYVMT